MTRSLCVKRSLFALAALFALTILIGGAARAADRAPAPTLADVHYGPHERNVLDFWAAPGASAAHPAPLVVFIHGGGWAKGDKTQVRDSKLVRECLDAGVSFAAINYRFRTTASLPEILRDCARAVQFLRTQSDAWHLDADRVAAYGSSAGAGTSLWLAFHPDLADPASADPVLRASTRLTCAGSVSGQFSYDFVRWSELFGPELIARYGKAYINPKFYGLKSDAELRGPAGAAIRADCDMIGLMNRNSPPFFVSSSLPDLGLDTSSRFLHHPTHSQRLYERARELGVPVVARIPAFNIAPPPGASATLRDFLLLHLRPTPPKPAAP
jgi:acetyl esterase/lipase